jgi:uncharacterized protein YcbK (DUF882 family)
MRIKNGVRFADPLLAMAVAVHVVRDVCARFNVTCTVTSGVEKHEFPSKHVLGAALDFRIRDFVPADVNKFAAEVRNDLGDGFDVVLESDHLHVEYDPKD